MDSHIDNDLIDYYNMLDAIELVPINIDFFTTIEFTPLNEHYRTILTLCELFLRDSSLGETIGNKTSNSFLIDMNRLFEKFIGNLLKEQLAGILC